MTGSPIELVCFDMAGTTMRDDGLVLAAFARTLDLMGVASGERAAMTTYVVETMGQSKIDVFTHLFGEKASSANVAFERALSDAVRDRGAVEIVGARTTVQRLRSLGLQVALTTGFAPATRDLLIDKLGWRDLFAIAVSPADAGRGRPAPDMILVCAMRARVTGVDAVVVVGDTYADMQAGRHAGVGRCIGVLTGADGQDRLTAGGADTVIASVVDVVDALDIIARQ